MRRGSPPIVVIGAGIGGLVASAELARRGADVVVIEKAPHIGGKMRRIHAGGKAIDAGPTVFTMRWVFDELFKSAGSSLDQHLKLKPVERLARHAWSHGPALDLYADLDRSADAVGEFAGPAEARGYRAFCAYAQGIFNTVDGPFLRSERPTLASMLETAGKIGLGALLGIDGHRTLWKSLGGFFNDPRLRQLFGRYATYCGSSPFLAPATLNVIAHVEREGVWLVEGGIYRLAEALADLAARAGARIRCGEEVAEILVTGGRASGVRLASGDRIDASAIVVNGDVAAVAAGLFGQKPARAVKEIGERSLSALTWAFTAEASGFPLIRHNVFFSDDYEGEFRELFDREQLPSDPTVYICAQDRDDDEGPGADDERFLCLINAPAVGDRRPFTRSEILECERRTWNRLHRSGLTLRRTSEPVITTPAEFNRLFPGTGGALYGPVSHGWKAPFVRASSRSRIPGLYLAGGSAHPGAGVPMAALSGSLAARSVTEDLALTRPSITTATLGGTSTP
ncbi:MAG: phytoene desaturase [Polyangiaceae bacterium]|nr:phytoene desaturase [Polyangiaceae bacterium]